MTRVGGIAYFLVIVTLIVLGFVIRPCFWIGLTVATVTMVAAWLLELLLGRGCRSR
ncbi:MULTISPECIES: hypothetical protein [Actinoplanes]|uniref:Uncharacterized protein n=1 Tax=Actinoplanes palleronii TaxID=113570 RepID=A0ABQ4B6M6_9ACTN|nr:MULTISPECIES: hypothetical protein [Actinoplanes]GIE66328.1 hypothetical protein Apa02nite_024360 [Actinoplanes palleronii]